MNLITPEIEDNKSLRQVGYDYMQPGFVDALKASAKEGFIRSPGPSFARLIELQQAKGWELHHESSASMGMGPVFIPRFNPKETEATGRHLTAEEWKESEHYRPGLSFPEGVPENAARIIADRKDEERKRQDVIRRVKPSLPMSAAMLTTDLLASALDPVNVAAAFVPVVREARAALWMQRFGKVGGRFAIGAVEGVAGAAMVEPIVLASAKAEQADYNMFNSLFNVGFGSVFGGGLHVGVGAMGDVLKKVRPFARDAAMKTAIGQVADGRAVDVEPILYSNKDVSQPERIYSDPVSSLEADEFLSSVPKSKTSERLQDEITVLSNDLGQMAASRKIDPSGLDKLTGELKFMDNSATNYERAVQAAVQCLMRVM